MAIVCVDTNVLIWGVKQECTPGQEDLLERAKHLLKQCQAAKDRVIVPAIVIGELLANLPLDTHEVFLRAIRDSSLVVVPYDLNTARLNAKIWQEQRPWEKLKEAGLSKQAVKTDVLIVATALAQRCNVLYTQDRGVYNLANFYTDCRYVSDVDLPAHQIVLLNL